MERGGGGLMERGGGGLMERGGEGLMERGGGGGLMERGGEGLMERGGEGMMERGGGGMMERGGGGLMERGGEGMMERGGGGLGPTPGQLAERSQLLVGDEEEAQRTKRSSSDESSVVEPAARVEVTLMGGAKLSKAEPGKWKGRSRGGPSGNPSTWRAASSSSSPRRTSREPPLAPTCDRRLSGAGLSSGAGLRWLAVIASTTGRVSPKRRNCRRASRSSSGLAIAQRSNAAPPGRWGSSAPPPRGRYLVRPQDAEEAVQEDLQADRDGLSSGQNQRGQVQHRAGEDRLHRGGGGRGLEVQQG
ncbi:hypothetical protein EYF80_055192 [Liparis tanakae]|uniref:Uncharacterized protein n=1 Tax=Liparis tanakae TaxID=230148 RepID=A0A4Z2F0I9_9TELE|nr:hypothetical protein EYF80_055192 [Liparis tanakae]